MICMYKYPWCVAVCAYVSLWLSLWLWVWLCLLFWMVRCPGKLLKTCLEGHSMILVMAHTHMVSVGVRNCIAALQFMESVNPGIAYGFEPPPHVLVRQVVSTDKEKVLRHLRRKKKRYGVVLCSCICVTHVLLHVSRIAFVVHHGCMHALVSLSWSLSLQP